MQSALPAGRIRIGPVPLPAEAPPFAAKGIAPLSATGFAHDPPVSPDSHVTLFASVVTSSQWVT